MVIAAIGIYLCLASLVWLAGGLLELLASGRWREVPATQAPLLLARLIDHPSAPYLAWPVGMRRAMPTPVLTDTWLALVAVAGLLAVFLAAKALSRT